MIRVVGTGKIIGGRVRNELVLWIGRWGDQLYGRWRKKCDFEKGGGGGGRGKGWIILGQCLPT